MAAVSNPIVDREARDRVVLKIRDALAQKSDPFDFCYDILQEVGKTADSTVHQICRWIFFYVDHVEWDIRALTRPQWNLWQRWLLILTADAYLDVTERKVWTNSQSLTLLCLMILVVGTLSLGWSGWTVCFWIGVGLLHEILVRSLAQRQAASQPPVDPIDEALWPFASFSELVAVRRSVPGFLKQKYPADWQGTPSSCLKMPAVVSMASLAVASPLLPLLHLSVFLRFPQTTCRVALISSTPRIHPPGDSTHV